VVDITLLMQHRRRSALQSRKWQLTGMSWRYRSTLCGRPLPAPTNYGPTQPKSVTLSLRP